MIEDADKSPDKVQKIVTEKVLKYAYSEQYWEPGDTQCAIRVGTTNGHQPRMM